MDENDRKFLESVLVKQSEQAEHRMNVLLDHFDHKIDLVVEGQQMLTERLDRMELAITNEIRKVDQRVNVLVADLAVHRTDTEAHHGIYRVKEGEEGFE